MYRRFSRSIYVKYNQRKLITGGVQNEQNRISGSYG